MVTEPEQVPVFVAQERLLVKAAVEPAGAAHLEFDEEGCLICIYVMADNHRNQEIVEKALARLMRQPLSSGEV